MDTILLIAAESREFAGLRRHLERVVRLQWPVECSWSGERSGKRFLLVANGPGPRLAAEAFEVSRSRRHIDAVVSTGFCGALDPGLERDSIFVASRVEAAEQALGYSARLPVTVRRYTSGRLVSGDRVIRTVEEKQSLRAKGADAVDMEAAAVASGAAEAGVAFFCVRVVMDTATEGFAFDLNAARDRQGRFSRWKLWMAACRQPRIVVPELLRLQRRSKAAAIALGDFIAECQF